MAIDAKRALSRLEAFIEFVVPAEWERAYRPLAMKTRAVGEDTTFARATGLAKKLVDPALADGRRTEVLSWSPSLAEWIVSDPRPKAHDEGSRLDLNAVRA